MPFLDRGEETEVLEPPMVLLDESVKTLPEVGKGAGVEPFPGPSKQGILSPNGGADIDRSGGMIRKKHQVFGVEKAPFEQ
jgi:hypothetical protein